MEEKLKQAEEALLQKEKELNSQKGQMEFLPQEVQEEGQLSFTVNATDPDGNSFTYSVENLPAGAETGRMPRRSFGTELRSPPRHS